MERVGAGTADRRAGRRDETVMFLVRRGDACAPLVLTIFFVPARSEVWVYTSTSLTTGPQVEISA